MSALRQLLQNPLVAIGLFIVLLALVVAILTPWIAPFPADACESHIMQRLRPPSAEFPFGKDSLGRNIRSRVILIAVSLLLAAMLIGVPIG